MEPLTDCCQKEAQKSLIRHRSVAVCDECGHLLLAYGNQGDYDLTVEELTNLEVEFQVGNKGKLLVISKER